MDSIGLTFDWSLCVSIKSVVCCPVSCIPVGLRVSVSFYLGFATLSCLHPHLPLLGLTGNERKVDMPGYPCCLEALSPRHMLIRLSSMTSLHSFGKKVMEMDPLGMDPLVFKSHLDWQLPSLISVMKSVKIQAGTRVTQQLEATSHRDLLWQAPFQGQYRRKQSHFSWVYFRGGMVILGSVVVC